MLSHNQLALVHYIINDPVHHSSYISDSYLRSLSIILTVARFGGFTTMKGERLLSCTLKSSMPSAMLSF